jgi:hypothetical protein
MAGEARAIELVEAFVRQVWAEAPADVRHLRATDLPPGGRWAGTLFANLILLWSGQNLLLLRTLAIENIVPVQTLSVVVSRYLRQLSAWLAHWRMVDTCRIADEVARALETGPELSPLLFGEMLAQLTLGLNRVQNWIDAYVPWAQLDSRLPDLSENAAPGLVARPHVSDR